MCGGRRFETRKIFGVSFFYRRGGFKAWDLEKFRNFVVSIRVGEKCRTCGRVVLEREIEGRSGTSKIIGSLL
jgi:hypothetical protein